MDGGGSKRKGNAFERFVCQKLSLWLTDGRRADVFTRNILSGGSFTRKARLGEELNIPGDVMAAHPEAYNFLQHFSIECKAHKLIHIGDYLFDFERKGLLAKIIDRAKADAARINATSMVICKQNMKPPVLILEARYGHMGMSFIRKRLIGGFRYHLLHGETEMCVRLDTWTSLVPANEFIEATC